MVALATFLIITAGLCMACLLAIALGRLARALGVI